MTRRPGQSIYRIHGGKYPIAPQIVALLPPHRVYVEPFGGAASVLLVKPRSALEVYNDLNGDAVNLFRVLQDDDMCRRLCQLVEVMPWSETEYHRLFDTSPEDPVDRAARFLFLAKASLGGDAIYGSKDGFRWQTKAGGTLATQWSNFPGVIVQTARRFKGVIIRQQDALRVICEHDAPDVCFYVDPPYLGSTRSGALYGDELMSDDEHKRLLEALLEVQGRVVLSGYDSALYTSMLSGWRKRTLRSAKRYVKGKSLSPPEIIWDNFTLDRPEDLGEYVQSAPGN